VGVGAEAIKFDAFAADGVAELESGSGPAPDCEEAAGGGAEGVT
jgi:hypothetical protein